MIHPIKKSSYFKNILVVLLGVILGFFLAKNFYPTEKIVEKIVYLPVEKTVEKVVEKEKANPASELNYTNPIYQTPSTATPGYQVPALATKAKSVKSVVEPDYPECPLPMNGSVTSYTQNERIAPFKVRTSVGSNYWLKLVDVSTNKDVLCFFVLGGTVVEIDVPLGSYVLKYATGDKWYGEKHLFGPYTLYNKADSTLNFKINGNHITGHTVTLYKVLNGNLLTEPISADQF